MPYSAPLHSAPTRARFGAAQTAQRGVTLTEALITLLIATVLITLAAPSFSHALQRQRVAGVMNEWLAAIALARSEAIRRGARVTMAPRSGTEWSSGVRVFADLNSNGAVDEDDTMVVELSPAPSGMRIEPHFGLYAAHYLSFNPLGQVRRPGSDGLVLGRMVMALDGELRTLCFATSRVRVVRAETCDSGAK